MSTEVWCRKSEHAAVHSEVSLAAHIASRLVGVYSSARFVCVYSSARFLRSFVFSRGVVEEASSDTGARGSSDTGLAPLVHSTRVATGIAVFQ